MLIWVAGNLLNTTATRSNLQSRIFLLQTNAWGNSSGNTKFPATTEIAIKTLTPFFKWTFILPRRDFCSYRTTRRGCAESDVFRQVLSCQDTRKIVYPVFVFVSNTSCEAE